MKKNRTVGIVLLVLGVMAVLGGTVNGTYAGLAYGVELSDIFMIMFTVAMILAGLILIIKNRKSK